MDVASASRFTLGGGYQYQGETDYPGRILDASFFKTWNVSGSYNYAPRGSTFQGLDVTAYYNTTEHEMNNDNKPTAIPNPPMRPGLDIKLPTRIKVGGGRAAAEWESGAWIFEGGADLLVTNRKAVRTVSNRGTGMVMFEDLVWPDATQSDVGLFGRGSWAGSRTVRITGALRFDAVASRADTASDFFLQEVSTNLDQDEQTLSAAVSAGFDLSRNWALSVSAGSATRTADVLERYSDRFPTSKGQLPNEFVGNPDLSPERSNQGDLWVQASYPKVTAKGSVFARKVDNYITFVATDLPKRLPLSPDVVYQYVNGDATFWGFDALFGWNFAREWTAYVGGDYTWGQDDLLDEPAYGITPARGRLGVRYDMAADRFFGEGILHVVADQNRVASSRGESPTDGYVTADFRFGWRFAPQLLLRFGVVNIADEFFVNHLNSVNPFTGQQIPEPGREIYVNLGWAF